MSILDVDMSNRLTKTSISQSRRPGSGAARRIREILDDCIQRRAAGESISDAQLISANPDLMPTLGDELELLRVLDRAASRARNESTRIGSSARPARFRFALATPERIGGYRILREIHRGAQGVVYLAEQESTRREVAVKVLVSRAFARSAEKARFVREAEILAKLRHPNIIAIHDTGIADGCHFFAMDYIEGRALDEELHAAPRDVRRTVELIVPIVDAVAAAHLRGVIHRDLKPSNIRVDGNGRPHVLDFGLAKVAADRSEQSMTADGQFIGSLPWASPEQVGGSGDLDVRSDVYSLGVILFQCLTKAFPYKVAGPIQDVLETITTAEPARPSRLRREIDGELDTIILKCLQKSAERRYQSAGELAADLRRYLSGEPIDAKRDSTLYVVGKHLRRHRLPVAFAVLALAGIVAFAFYAANQAQRNAELARSESAARSEAEFARADALAAQSEAEAQRDAAQRSRDAENAQRRAAEDAAARAEAIKNFFVQTMGVANPDVSQSGGVTLATLLDRAASQIDATFANDPASEATVRTVIGQAFATLGQPEQAREHLERAVEIHEKILETPPRAYYEALWTFMNVQGEVAPQDEWRARWWQVWRLYPRLLETKNVALGRIVKSLAESHFGENYSDEKSGPLYYQMMHLAESALAATDPEWLLLADFLHLAGENLGLKFQKDAGIRVLGDALAIERRFLAETNPRVVRTSAALTNLFLEKGRNTEAEAIARGTLAALEQSLQPSHWYLAVLRARVAACQIGQGDFESAEATLRASLAQIEAEHGYASRYAIEVMSHLARLYENWERPAEAEEARSELARRFAQSIDSMVIFRIDTVMGPRFAKLREALAKLRYAVIAREKNLVPLAEEISALCRETLPADHPLAALVSEYLVGHGKAYSNKHGLNASSRALFKEAQELAANCPGMRPEKRALAAWWLAYDLKGSQEYDAALPLARLAYELWEADSTVNPGRRGLGKNLYGGVLSKLGDSTTAEPLLVEGFQQVLHDRGTRHADTDNALRRVIVHFRDLGQPSCAIPHVLATMQLGTGNVDCLQLMLATEYPEAMKSIAATKWTRNPSRAALSQAIERALAQRRATIPDESPYAAICADLMYSQIDNGARTDDCDLWEPLAAEVVRLHTLHFGPNHRKTTYALWWHSMTLLSAGEYERAWEIGKQGHQIRLERLSSEFTGGHSRFEHILCGALIGLVRWDEADTLISRSLREYYDRYGEANYHTLELFGQAMWLRALRGQPEQAAEAANPILEGLLAANADARTLQKVARKVVLSPGLGGKTYALALDAARAAHASNPRLPNIGSTIALALIRLDRPDEALKDLGKQGKSDVFDPDESAAVRLLALAGAGQVEEASASLKSLQDIVTGRNAQFSGPVLRRLLEEAEGKISKLSIADGARTGN